MHIVTNKFSGFWWLTIQFFLGFLGVGHCVEEDVLSKLPQGIHIERIPKQTSHYDDDDDVMAQLPPGISIKKVKKPIYKGI